MSILRLKPFDTITEEGRSSERFRRGALTALASALSKAVSMVGLVISVPITLHYLGAERYGMWMTISSVVVMFGFADLGMGNGLMSLIAGAHGKNDTEAAQRSVSSSFFLLSAIASLLLIAFAGAYPYVSWHGIFNVTSPVAVHEAGTAMAVLFVCFAVSMPLGVVQRVQNGFQEGFQSGLWQTAGNILGFAGLMLMIRLRAGLPWLVLAVEGLPVAVALLNGLYFFGVQKRWLLPLRRYWSAGSASRILHTGMLFFALQLAMTFATTTDNLVIAHMIGSRAVAPYAVTARLFSVITILANMLIFPLWPAYGEAFARGDADWVRRALKRSMWMSVALTAIPSFLLILLGGGILHVWVGSSVVAPLGLLVGFGVWSILDAFGNTMAMFLNGAHVVKFQVTWTTTFAIFALAAKIALARVFGITGIIWAMDASYFLLLAIPYAMFVKGFLRNPGSILPARGMA